MNSTNKQLVREAKIGLTICALLAGLFFYVTWNRITGSWETIPEHVQNAPLAQNMEDVYKAEYQRNQLGIQSSVTASDPSPFRLTKAAAEPVVSKTVPKTDKPLTFNALRAPIDHNVKPTKFESNDNSFRVSTTKPNNVPNSNEPTFSAPSTKPNRPKRHVFEIDSPKLIEPKKSTPDTPETKSNDFKIRANSDANLTLTNSQSTPFSDDSEQEFVPLSSSSNSKVTARTTFQVQVEPATTPDPVVQETIAPKPPAESFTVDPSPFKPIPTTPTIETQAVSVQNEPASDFQAFKPQPVVRRPNEVKANEFSSDSFLKRMPTSPTCLEGERCPSKELKSTDDRAVASPSLHSDSFAEVAAPLELTKAEELQEIEHIDEPESSLFESDMALNSEPPSAWNAGMETERESRREEAIQRGVYRVSQNETLWSISQTVYGDGRLFRALYELNRNQIPDPNHVSTGTNLMTPPLSELVSNWEAIVPEDLRPTQTDPNAYVTKKGDTLFHVARIQLGQASRFDELMDLNQSRLNLDTHHLTELPAGMTLQLPQAD